MMARLRELARREVPGPWLGAWLLAACAAVVVVYLTSGLGLEAWDDSHFFKRIGLNILEHGTAAWNVEDGPVYGNTSQGFQLLALIPLLLDADHYIAIVKVMSALAMVLLFAVYLRAARRMVADATPSDRAIAWGAAFLAACAPYLLLLVHSGMETSVALVVLALNLVVIHGAPRTRAGIAAVVGTTVAVFLTRPDAVAISLVVIGAYGWGRDGRPPWRVLAWCGVGLAAVLGALYLYFGTPVPLAFYLKSRALTVYTPDFVELSLALKRRNLIGLMVMAAPLLYVAGHGRGAWSRSLVASFALFGTYHYFSTIEVMGWFSRFYVPGLVPLALAAIAAAPDLRRRSRPLVTIAFCALYLAGVLYLFEHRLIYDATDGAISRVPRALYLAYAIGWSVLLIGARIHAGAAAALVAIPLAVGAVRGLPPMSLRFPSDMPLIERYMDGITTVRGLRSVRECIPEPLRLYHTEIGVPGVMFQRSTITDMAGLMDQDIAFHGMDFDARCQRDRPEVIFLPHRNYKALRARIARGTCLRGYRRVVRDSSSPLYIRSDLAADFLACARRVGDKWVR
ncbi:MAG TPA: hypothetical protein VK698_27365 [Kofleriaceae bacterium]|nr:hypothetical protein [Kofleriaceae bacterium]